MELVKNHRPAMSLSELSLVVGARGMTAAGVALLFGDRLSQEQRRAVPLYPFYGGYLYSGLRATSNESITMSYDFEAEEIDQQWNWPEWRARWSSLGWQVFLQLPRA